MSFSKIAAQEVWQQYRQQFPVTERFVYLNHSAVSPLSHVLKENRPSKYPMARRSMSGFEKRMMIMMVS